MPQGEQNLKPPDLGDDVLPRLRDLVMRCPCTVLEGIRWSVVCKVYTDRYQGGPIGASTLDAAKKSLADLVIFDETNRPPGDALLRLTDAAALSVAQPGQLGCWPLLVQRLSEIVQDHGSRWDPKTLEVRETEEAIDSEVCGVLLGQLKPLLSRHWDSGFEERGIVFFNEVGQFVNLRKMKHFIAELLKWRAKRQDLILSQVLTPSAVDRALETKLILATSQRHNDMVLCCGPRSSRSVASPPLVSPNKAWLHSSPGGAAGSEASLSFSPPPQEEVSTPKVQQKSLEKESQRLRIENAELKKRLQFGSEFLKQENRRLRVENAELKKRLYFAGPYAQGSSQSSVPIWVPVPVMASGCGGCAASPSARGAVPVPQASSSEQVSPHSVREGSVTPIPRGFWVPLPSNVMSPTGQPWPPGSQLVAVQIGPAQTPPGSFSETSQQERFLPHNILSDPTTASQVSANTSNTSPDCHSSGFVVPFQGTDDRWVCIPSGIVERHKAQFEAPSTDGHEELAHSSAQASTEARGSGSAS
ncbi:unnamed protein product [Durusdinium trenchii]|uniref:Uncharacterized protein n=1 Tax=Durusdinium trenchii TaxID=1381693 RepID=A0ABP0PDL1_9DINO